MTIQKILVPVLTAKMSGPILRQAAYLARLNGAKIILLHVVPPQTSKEAGAQLIAQAQADLDQMSWPQLDDLVISRLVRSGDPARQILQTARQQRSDLIMLALDARWQVGSGWRGPRVFQRFLLHSVAARVIEEAPCSVWTIRNDAPAQDFQIRRVLCFMDLTANNGAALSRAAEIAAATGASLSLFHAIPSTEIWVPGGSRFSHMWKETFTNIATKEIAELQDEAGTQADILIESGTGPPMLISALEKLQTDLLVAGHFTPQSPSEDYADIHAIIRNVPVPILISKSGTNGMPAMGLKGAGAERSHGNIRYGYRAGAGL